MKASKTSRVLLICSSQEIFFKFVIMLSEFREEDFNTNEFVIFHVNLFSESLQLDKKFLQQLENKTSIPTIFKISMVTPRHRPTDHCQVRQVSLTQNWSSLLQKGQTETTTKFSFPSYYSDALHLYARAMMSLRQNGLQLHNIKGKDIIGEIWNKTYNGTLGRRSETSENLMKSS